MNDKVVPGLDRPEPLPHVPTVPTVPTVRYVPTVLDAEAAPDDVAAWAATVTPGSAVLTPLAVLDPARLSHTGRVDALVALERQLAWLQARQHRLLAVMAADPAVATPAGELAKHWVREDVASALRLSPLTAADRLCLASELTRLPATVDLLERGEITAGHARHLGEATMALDDPSAADVEARVLAQAPQQTLANFRRAVTRAVLTAAPRDGEQRHAQAATARRVARAPQGDAMSTIWMLLPDPGATVFMTAIDALARRTRPGDERTADQRRADAAIQLALDALNGASSAELPREHRMRPTIHVTVALSSLLGLDEQPADLHGSGPIPAALARRIAADPSGTWRRLVTDPLGQLIDYGRSTYRPPKDLTDHVIARDRTCRFPHCNRQACRCDLDHQTPWQRGRTTNAANLNTICCRHHHAKHDAGWTPTRQPDGTIEWTSPTGHRYREPAATYPTDTTTQRKTETDIDTAPDPPPF
jgi:hypothetical protein